MMSHDKEAEMLRLDNQLCFAVYASAKAIVGAYRTELEKMGLTYTQYIALLALWEKEEMTLKELGRRLFLDSGTIDADAEEDGSRRTFDATAQHDR